ncbi:vacuolar -sorting-associated 25 [Brachionus plicatilis]|uniref:Vacuolar protein-sorting-associated protein 25 n=1 Tax=Brachionus plicatilis TaxID=10195 RepID=A0A3M7S3Z4_BRAPC|nr:vacuolar -sorting-associated 25 [Brachionus plicatilis]
MEFPWQYNFPPFFTLQPNEDTKRKQLDAWSDLVLAYCKFNRIFQFDVNEMQTSELFSNKKIDRKCSLDLICVIIDELVGRNKAEWQMHGIGKNSRRNNKCFIYWNALDEWARIIYDYVVKNGLQNTVCTIYELIDSEEVKKEPFYRLDRQIFLKSIKILENSRKAELIHLDDENEPGIKFF